jgi:hypothetical protein
LVDELIVDRLNVLFHALEPTNFSTLVTAFMTYRQNTWTGQDFWRKVLITLRDYYPNGQAKVGAVLTHFANHAVSPLFATQRILPGGGELDTVFEDQMEMALQGRNGSAAATTLMQLILPVFSELLRPIPLEIMTDKLRRILYERESICCAQLHVGIDYYPMCLTTCDSGRHIDHPTYRSARATPYGAL